MSQYLIGIDIGGTTVKFGLFNTENFPKTEAQFAIPTHTENEGANILPDTSDAIMQMLRDHDLSREDIAGIGVGVPGPVITDNETGSTLVNRCVNLGWNLKNVAAELSRMTAIHRVTVMNDANAAALGEMSCGSGGDTHDISVAFRDMTAVLITIGTGVGGGIVQHGQVITGVSGCAGEFGHIKLSPVHPLLQKVIREGGDVAPFEDFEYYASATGIIRMAKVGAEVLYPDSQLAGCKDMGAKEVFAAAKDGDPLALEVTDFFFDTFGLGMAIVTAGIDPDVLIIGGGVAGEGEPLLKRIKGAYQKYAFHGVYDTELRLAALGNDAGLIGPVVPIYLSTQQ